MQDSVIDAGCTIGARFAATGGPTQIRVNGGHRCVDIGVMMGAGCTIGSNVVAEAGTILGNGCSVQSLKLISGKLPDGSMVY